MLPQNEIAKRWLHDNGFPNTLHDQFPDTFCGQPTWTPEREGKYQIGILHHEMPAICEKMEAAGLTQEGA